MRPANPRRHHSSLIDYLANRSTGSRPENPAGTSGTHDPHPHHAAHSPHSARLGVTAHRGRIGADMGGWVDGD